MNFYSFFFVVNWCRTFWFSMEITRVLQFQILLYIYTQICWPDIVKILYLRHLCTLLRKKNNFVFDQHKNNIQIVIIVKLNLSLISHMKFSWRFVWDILCFTWNSTEYNVDKICRITKKIAEQNMFVHKNWQSFMSSFKVKFVLHKMLRIVVTV